MRAHVLLFTLASVLSITACSNVADEPSATSRSRLVDDVDEHPNVVKIESTRGGLCSGVLVAPNVVLTARHCVVELDDHEVRCGSNVLVRTRLGAETIAPSDFAVTVDDGSRALLTRGVSTIHVPSDDVLCNGDVAALVLDEPVPTNRVNPAAMRLDVGIAAGERLTVVGFGERPDGSTGERHHRSGIRVERVGPRAREGGRPTLGAHEIETSLGFCQGDSGGPALDPETGAVVALVSRNETCTAPNGYVFTAISGFRTMIERAFAEANAKMILDDTGYVLETPKRAVGNECESAGDCGSGLCIADRGAKYCSRECLPGAQHRECPPDWSCNGVADSPAKVCSRGVAPRVDAEPRDIRLDSGEGEASMSCAATPPRRSFSREAPRAAFAVVVLIAAFCLVTRRRTDDERTDEHRTER